MELDISISGTRGAVFIRDRGCADRRDGRLDPVRFRPIPTRCGISGAVANGRDAVHGRDLTGRGRREAATFGGRRLPIRCALLGGLGLTRRHAFARLDYVASAIGARGAFEHLVDLVITWLGSDGNSSRRSPA